MDKSFSGNILLVKNRAMGDAVIGLSTIQYLKQVYPNCKVYYAVPEWICPLFSKVETAADGIIPLKLNSIRDWLQFFKTLKNYHLDHIHELFQSGRTHKFFRLYSLLTGIPYTAHNHHHKNGLVHDQGEIKSNIQRDLDGIWSYLGKPLGHPIPHYLKFPPHMTGKNSISHNNIIFGVVATRETKKWDLKNFKALAQLIAQWDTEMRILIPLSSSSGDQEIKAKINELNFPNICQFVEAPLNELPLKLQGSKLYVGNDTGIKHICAALNIPTVTLFGPEPPTEWHPYNPIMHPYFFLEPLLCRTKDAHYCGLHTCPEMECLKNFTAESVFGKLQELISD